MKKSILLLVASLIAGFVNGQLARHDIQFNIPNTAPLQTQHLPLNETGKNNFQNNYARPAQGTQFPKRAAKTTTTLSRWYDYSGEYFVGLLQPYEANVLSQDLNYYRLSMWNDTSAIWGNTGTTTPYRTSDGEVSYNSNLSIAQGLDPAFPAWNAWGVGAIITDFIGEMATTIADAYTIDSVLIPGWYTRSTINTPAKIAVVDTLIVSFVTGAATGSDLPPGAYVGIVVPPYYCVGCASEPYLDLYHDISDNRAAHNGGGVLAYPGPQVYKFLLNSADSNANVYKSPRFPRRPADGTINVPVAAGQTVAVTVTFKSGDTAYPAFPAHDTVRTSDGTSILSTKYSYWDAQVFYVAATSTNTTPLWYWYDAANRATSYFEFGAHGWGPPAAKYCPNWDIIAGTPTAPIPAASQTPHMGFHALCTTCYVIVPIGDGVKNVESLNGINAKPNPADNELTISYQGAQRTVSVSLTNMIGQVVATQNVTDGKAVFNTTALADGIYIYSLQANGERSMGRVVIAH